MPLTEKELDELNEKYKGKKFIEAELKTIDNVEIFATGVWNGEKFTEKDLDDIVDAFGDTREKLKPFLKIGHSEKQELLARDEMPSAGLVSSVRRVGQKLLADFIDVPKKIYDVVKKRAFNKISSELFVNMNIDGKRHPLALKAVALLGGETPAVHDLDSILDLFANKGAVMAYKKDQEIKEIQFSKLNLQEDDMSAEIERKLAQAEGKIKNFEEEISEVTKDLSKSQSELSAAKEEVKAYKEKYEASEKLLSETKEKAKQEKIEGVLSKAVIDGKIDNSQKSKYSALLNSLKETETKEFSIGEKKYTSLEELVFSIIDTEKQEFNMDDQAGNGESSKGDDALIKKAKEYAEEHKVSFTKALEKISE